MLNLIVQLVSGAVGGNIAGSFMKNLSLGTVGNSLPVFWAAALVANCSGFWGLPSIRGGMDIGSIVSSIAGGGGGGVLMAIIGVIKKAIAK
jgi:hypothetical protein